jgi:RecA/RadA recombinase
MAQALQIWQARNTSNQTSFLSTSLKQLDAVLKGGFPAGTITEVCCVIFCMFFVTQQ